MSVKLESFPKFTSFIENPLDKQGHLGAPQFKALSYFKTVEAWREQFEKELTERLEEAKRKEFGIADWPYEAGKNKATQELLAEILSVIQDTSKQGEQEVVK